MIIIAFITVNLLSTSANQDCTTNYDPPKYHLIEKCHRSKLGIVAYANFTSLTSCQRLGLEKKGLALNFSPPEARDGMDHYSCEVLRCAETEGGWTLVNDTRFDYYSLYARPLPNENSTCVPATGMFFLLPQPKNYTEAQHECKNMTGVLADIITEHRTEILAQVLLEASVEKAYVGMTRYNKSSFSSDNGTGSSLDCSTYRAWAPGHPNRNFYNYDCMLITWHKTWMTTSCSKPHQALCELLPKGPYKRGLIFASRIKNDTESEEIPK